MNKLTSSEQDDEQQEVSTIIISNSKQVSKANMKQQKEEDSSSAADHKFWWRKTRIHVALLGLAIAAVNCYAQATFCIAIVEMVLPADYDATIVKLVDVLPATSSSAPSALLRVSTLTNRTAPEVPLEQSCPIEFKYRDYYDSWRFPLDSTSVASSLNGSAQQQQQPVIASSKTVDVSNRFDWDASQQGLLLGAFAVGTAPLQVIGGRLAEIYGSKWVLLLGCLGTALTNLTIPYLAHFSFLLLLINRILMGVAQAGMEPGLMCLLADWLTPQEAGFFISMLLFAICMGFFLGSLCSSFILALGYGWPLAYYVSGGLNLLVGVVWYFYADSWPHASQYINQNELDYIAHEQRRVKCDLTTSNNISSSSSSPAEQQHISTIACTTAEASAETVGPHNQVIGDDSASQGRAPWRNILSTRSVWAFIICKISVRWCADVLSNELPTYLANVLHLSIKINGLLNSISTALFAISSFITGYLANELFVNETSKLTNKTHVRKAFQSVASFGSALCIILMTQYDCDIVFSMSMLLILSCCLVMGTGGELQIPYDMTSRYPGTLHGLACTLSVSGWLAPPLIGLILGDQPSSRSRWSIVWYSTAAINLIGGLVFVLFADANPRDFDHRATKEEKVERTKERRNSTTSGCYFNVALSNSSAENSPKSSHSNQPGTGYLLQQNINQVDEKVSKAATSLFDCDKLIKMRQLESSFIRPGAFSYPLKRDLDSPMDNDDFTIILPFQETATTTSKRAKQTNQVTTSSTSSQSTMSSSNELEVKSSSSQSGELEKPDEMITMAHDDDDDGANNGARTDLIEDSMKHYTTDFTNEPIATTDTTTQISQNHNAITHL